MDNLFLIILIILPQQVPPFKVNLTWIESDTLVIALHNVASLVLPTSSMTCTDGRTVMNAYDGFPDEVLIYG